MDANFRLGFEAGSAFQLAVSSAAGGEFETLRRAAGVLHGALEKAGKCEEVHHEGTKDTKGEEKTEKILPQEAQKAQRVGKKRGRPAKVSGAWPGAMCSEDRPATGTAPPKKGGDRGTRRCSICGTPKGVTAFEAGGGMVCLVCRKKNAIRTDRAISKALAE